MKAYVISGYDLNWKTLLTPKVFLNKKSAEDYYNSIKENSLQVYDFDEVEISEIIARHGRWINKGEYAVCTECGNKSGT